MRLRTHCDMTLEAAEDCPAIGMLRPSSGLAQWLVSEHYDFQPQLRIAEFVDSYGNLCQRFVIPRGQLRIQIETVVEIEDTIAVAPNAPLTPVAQLPDSTLQFLLPSRYVPSDKMEAQARQIVGSAAPGYAQVEAIRAWIHGNLKYQYGVSQATTDAQETIAAGAGVCRDFSHVGIALTRALRIPARMVVGYLYKLDPMDLHAWFEAFIDGRWYIFDGTQDHPVGGRIVVAYGHDAANVAFISNYGALQTKALKVAVDLENPS